ncbi:hypothetical protein GMST_20820 [Geomonas silvestris]|uniref:Sel1 repeat family protein n=1 Tax=Geomonas silvestris TaxID=2740184 RepID=A0A6V8MIJ7_9BACT|nr:tetratricopeptide repeat protein [Geomonas silvestris]GFO59757.1 hypothetical protein GMST_20820 [Geomonas silvestris]
MTKDTLHGTGIQKCECTAPDEQESCNCACENDSTPTTHNDKLIDFKQRSSELRKKGLLSSSVSAFEATRALAFGIMYLTGEGVVRDTARAAEFLATAAKGGISQAKHELAKLHLEGVAVPYDPDYARLLLEGASDDEYLPSTVYLAEMYLFGKNGPKDIEAALELLYVGAAKSDPAAMYYLALIYDKEAEYQNSFEAAYWYRRAAEYGHFKSQIRLASLYAMGQGVPQCPETAQAFLEVAQESLEEQDPRFLLWQGEHFVAQPETEFLAQALIQAAADMHHTPAQRVLMQRGWRR